MDIRCENVQGINQFDKKPWWLTSSAYAGQQNDKEYVVDYLNWIMLN